MRTQLLAAATFDTVLRQQATLDAQKRLVGQVNQTWEEARDDNSGELLQAKLANTLHADLERIATFNQVRAQWLEGHKGQEGNLYFGIRFHKMEEAAKGALEVLPRLLSGDKFSLSNFSSSTAFPELASTGYYGSSKPTFVSYALLSTYLTIGSKLAKDIPLDFPITHVHPLPQDFEIPADFKWGYEQGGQKGLLTVHSGYSFGGFRNQSQLYPKGKIAGPEDCSSWVGKLTKFNFVLTTADQLCAYRKNVGGGFVPENWQGEGVGTVAPHTFTNIDVAKVEPGDIYFSRNFKADTDSSSTLGTGGHTGIVAHKPTSSEVMIISANRDIPNFEGFGLRAHTSVQANTSTVNTTPYFTQFTPQNEIRLPYASLFSLVEYEGADFAKLSARSIELVEEAFAGSDVSNGNALHCGLAELLAGWEAVQ